MAVTVAEAAFRLHQLQRDIPSAAKMRGLLALRAALTSPSLSKACAQASDLNDDLVMSLAVAASDRALCTSGVWMDRNQQLACMERRGTCPVTATPVVHLSRHVRALTRMSLPPLTTRHRVAGGAVVSTAASSSPPQRIYFPGDAELEVYDEACRISVVAPPLDDPGNIVAMGPATVSLHALRRNIRGTVTAIRVAPAAAPVTGEHTGPTEEILDDCAVDLVVSLDSDEPFVLRDIWVACEVFAARDDAAVDDFGDSSLNNVAGKKRSRSSESQHPHKRPMTFGSGLEYRAVLPPATPAAVSVVLPYAQEAIATAKQASATTALSHSVCSLVLGVRLDNLPVEVVQSLAAHIAGMTNINVEGHGEMPAAESAAGAAARIRVSVSVC